MAKSKIINKNEQLTPEKYREIFGSDETLWFNDGRWGACGYAMANGQGKTSTNNDTIFSIHNRLGLMLFSMMHQSDVRFSAPPHKYFWRDVEKAIVAARIDLFNRRVDPGTERALLEKHVAATPRTFLVYPVPYFGERVRQERVRFMESMALNLLSEIQQHSANERPHYVSGTFVDMVFGYLAEIHAEIAMNFFGYTVDEILGDGIKSWAGELADGGTGDPFVIEEARYAEENYRPQEKYASSENVQERPPRLWWPTENDLSAIRGVPYTTAQVFAARWPQTHLNYEGDWESTLPGGSEIQNRVQQGDQTFKN